MTDPQFIARLTAVADQRREHALTKVREMRNFLNDVEMWLVDDKPPMVPELMMHGAVKQLLEATDALLYAERALYSAQKAQTPCEDPPAMR
jgi:hypothetical protein